jgi:hypothetical protein
MFFMCYIFGLKPATWLFIGKRHKCRSYLFLPGMLQGFSIIKSRTHTEPAEVMWWKQYDIKRGL